MCVCDMWLETKWNTRSYWVGSVTLHSVGGRDMSSKRSLKTHPEDRCWHFSASLASLGISFCSSYSPLSQEGAGFLFSHVLLTVTNT